MNVAEAVEWAVKNCTEETCARLRSRAVVKTLLEEIVRLETIIDSRPAMNAGLEEAYIKWTQGIAVGEFCRVMEDMQ